MNFIQPLTAALNYRIIYIIIAIMNDAIVLRNIINIAFEYEIQDGRGIKHELHPVLVPDVLNAIIEYNPVSLSEHDIMLAAVIMYQVTMRYMIHSHGTETHMNLISCMHFSYRAVKYAARNTFNERIANLKHGYPVEYAIKHMKTTLETNACN